MPSNQPPNSMRSRTKKRTVIALALLFISLISILFLFTRQGQELLPLFLGIAVVGLIIAIIFGLDARWSRARAQEVDDILDGRDRLAFWTYPANDGSGHGTVYIGWQGTYLNNEYFHYQDKNRRLERAYLVKNEPIGTLRLICRHEVTRSEGDRRPGKQIRFPTIAIPVPPGMTEIAENIVAQYVERFNIKTVNSGE